MKNKNTITVVDNRNNNKFEFKIKKGSFGPDVADLTAFYSKTGMFVYDPGFTSTASCSSEITFMKSFQGLYPNSLKFTISKSFEIKLDFS